MKKVRVIQNKIISALLFRPVIENKLYGLAGLGLVVLINLNMRPFISFTLFILGCIKDFILCYYVMMGTIGFGFGIYYLCRLDKLYKILKSPMEAPNVRKRIITLSDICTLGYVAVHIYLYPEVYTENGLPDVFKPFVKFAFTWGIFFGVFYAVYLSYYLMFRSRNAKSSN